MKHCEKTSSVRFILPCGPFWLRCLLLAIAPLTVTGCLPYLGQTLATPTTTPVVQTTTTPVVQTTTTTPAQVPAPASIAVVAPAVVPTRRRYGGYVLRKGDKDGNPGTCTPPTYGGEQDSLQSPLTPPPLDASWELPESQPGVAQATAGPNNSSTCTLAIKEYVQDLQRDLRELGFLIIKGDANGNIATDDDNGPGKFGLTTEWAVKEFQIYASMSHVAMFNEARLRNLLTDAGRSNEMCSVAWQVARLGKAASNLTLPATVTPHPVSYYVASLDSVENPEGVRYTGPITGVLNAATRKALQYWLENNFRCPVV